MKKLFIILLLCLSYTLSAQGDITKYKFEYDSNWKCLTDANSFRCSTMISIASDSVIYIENDNFFEEIYWDSISSPMFFDTTERSNIAIDIFKNNTFAGRILFNHEKDFIGFMNISDCKYVLYINNITSIDNFF